MPKQVNDRVVARAQDGDKQALSALYEHYRPHVYRYLFYRVGDRQTAEDLTTEVFLRIIEALPGYRRMSGPFEAWMFRIARNLSVDHFRKMKVRNHTQLDDSIEAIDETPPAVAERSLTIAQLRAALKFLTADQYDVIVMRFVADMPVAEVASALEKSESAVKALQARGLASLYRILSQRQVIHYG